MESLTNSFINSRLQILAVLLHENGMCRGCRCSMQERWVRDEHADTCPSLSLVHCIIAAAPTQSDR